MRIADRLSRGKGRLRVLDAIFSRPLPAPHRPSFAEWENAEVAAAWLGHATVLLRIGGKTILTDPVFSTRVGLSLAIATGGPARLVAPALRVGELPKIDLILVSHAHFDHLDRPTLARLPKNVPVITARNTRDLLDDLGYTNVSEVGWGDIVKLNGLSIKGWEVNHWGARTMTDTYRTACAFLLEAGKRRVLFGGDSAYGKHFAEVGGVDLAAMGIGAYNPWIKGHATPEQAWDMAQQMRAKFVLPMHHKTFRLSHEPMEEPLERMQQAAGRDADRLVASEIGQTWVLGSA